MPSGRTHLLVELLSLPVWAGLGARWGWGRSSVVAFSLAYVGGSLFLSPDLDLEGSAPARRWGPLRLLWKPYAALFRHRGLSHSPIWGPLTRFAYLALLFLVVWATVSAVLPSPPAVPSSLWAPVVVGAVLPQVLHVLVDRLLTPPRPRKRGRPR